MSNLTNFNNFELNTEETTNVNGGRGCGGRRRRRKSRRSNNNCYSSYNNCYSSYNDCEPTVEVAVEPIIETPVIETPAPAVNFLGVAGA